MTERSARDDDLRVIEVSANVPRKWVEALAKAVRAEAGRVHGITDHGFELGAIALFKAAERDGWKMTPKQSTPKMFQKGASVWEWMWNEAPSPGDEG